MLIALVLALGLADAPQDPAADASLRRIQRALAAVPAAPLQIELPKPTFRVEVRERVYYKETPPQWEFLHAGGVPFRTPSPAGVGTAPIVQVDIGQIIRAVKKVLPDRDRRTPYI